MMEVIRGTENTKQFWGALGGGPDEVDSKENERRKIGHMKRTFAMSFVIKFVWLF